MLGARGLQALLVVDEPALAVRDARPEVWEPLRGRVVWGVLAAHRPERAAHAAWRLGAALARVGLSTAAVGPSSLLTASCGTGHLPPRREAEVTAALAYVATSARHGAVRDASGRA